MSESSTFDSNKSARNHGANEAIHIGSLSIPQALDFYHYRQREIRAREALHTESNAIDLAQAKLQELLTSDKLSGAQFFETESAACILKYASNDLRKGADVEAICSGLFDTYFHFKFSLGDTDASQVLRTVGDDLAADHGFDPAITLALFLDAQDKAIERGIIQ